MGKQSINYIEGETKNTKIVEKLLEKSGLRKDRKKGSIQITPQILKYLFGKGGIVRLLQEDKDTTQDISYFKVLADTVISAYKKLKLEQIGENAFSEDEKATYQKLIKLDAEKFERLGAGNNNLTEAIRDLKKSAVKWESIQSAFGASGDHAARRCRGLGDILRSLAFFRVSAKAKEKADNRKKSISEKTEDRNKKLNVEELSKQIKELTNIIMAENKKSLAELTTLTGNQTAFCDICKKAGKEYLKRRKVHFYSRKVSKLKRETATILTKLAPIPIPKTGLPA